MHLLGRNIRSDTQTLTLPLTCRSWDTSPPPSLGWRQRESNRNVSRRRRERSSRDYPGRRSGPVWRSIMSSPRTHTSHTAGRRQDRGQRGRWRISDREPQFGSENRVWCREDHPDRPAEARLAGRISIILSTFWSGNLLRMAPSKLIT